MQLGDFEGLEMRRSAAILGRCTLCRWVKKALGNNWELVVFLTSVIELSEGVLPMLKALSTAALLSMMEPRHAKTKYAQLQGMTFECLRAASHMVPHTLASPHIHRHSGICRSAAATPQTCGEAIPNVEPMNRLHSGFR